MFLCAFCNKIYNISKYKTMLHDILEAVNCDVKKKLATPNNVHINGLVLKLTLT